MVQMANRLHRLTASQVKSASGTALFPDGGGLYLQVSASGSKSWVFRFTLRGRTRDMGLGSTEVVMLAEARDLAHECRKLVHEGIDPIEQRALVRSQRDLQRATSKTFAECTKAYIDDQQEGWRNPKSAIQWRNSLRTYADPIFGNLPVQEIDTVLIRRVLDPIWKTKTETANRVRQRIENILDWATVSGFRTGDNPARWKGHLQALLQSPAKLKKVQHMAALPYPELGAFMVTLAKMKGHSPRAVEFQILTVARPGMVLLAEWSEINLDDQMWTIPGDRMKAGREHRVPLSGWAVEILEKVLPLATDGNYIFPGARQGRPLSNMAPMAVLRRMGRGDLTAHGFRSTFSDWCAEQTPFPAEVREMALAHSIGNKAEAAYRRGDLFEKRCPVMDAWADFAGTVEKSAKQGQVIPLRSNV